MKILGIDTTTGRLCLGLYVDGKFYEYSLQTGRNLSALLVPVIGRVIGAVGLKIAQIDYFACGLGPGSFTGMRIGLATIKGLSVVKNKPVIGISTLDILAKNAGPQDRLIVSALDSLQDKLHGFNLGADDYLAKSSEMPELLARVEVLAGRATEAA